ncbi:MAG: cupin domain-containing protein [Ignavibacteriales bacterium]|nr:cupin domain-containing protein [Ignavibacteriales bacterium]
MNSKHWIEKLQLSSHPEGGYFREIYRAEGIIAQPSLPMRYNGGRAYSTTIYYLLESNDVSSLHRLKSDEQWFHIDGGALTIHSIDPKGNYTAHHIGKNLDKGELPHAVVRTGCWFGGTVNEPDSFSLVGCVVAPGFHFDDFELAKRIELVRQFPQHKSIIEKLTR